MFKKGKPRQWSGRALPLRNEQISYNTQTTVIGPNNIWFTPEVIIFDAVDFLVDIIWLWVIFKRLVPVSIVRIAVISLLIFIVIGSRQDVFLSAAGVPVEAIALAEPEQAVEISTQIKAAKKQSISWPVPKNAISTYFSYHHKGIDVPTSYGRSVKSFSAGTVVFAGWSGTGFGKLVRVQHEGGYLTKYAHLASLNVKVGQKVGSDTTIGTVGTTGYATGAHLHFEVYKNGVAVNPLIVLP